MHSSAHTPSHAAGTTNKSQVDSCLSFLQIIGETGTVQSVTDPGDLRVRFNNGMMWTINPAAVTKVSYPPPCDVIVNKHTVTACILPATSQWRV